MSTQTQLIFDDETIKQELKRDVILQIEMEEDYFNPRTDNDNAGKMVCFHKRYELGDEKDSKFEDFNSWDEIKKHLIKNCDAKVILPLYLYDHSGITINTKGFSCSWDSMKVGFIYLDKQTLLKEWNIKRLSKKERVKRENYLIGEVETYDDYLTGNVRRFTLIDKLTGDEIDSVGCFFGNDYLNDMKGYVNFNNYKSVEIVEN